MTLKKWILCVKGTTAVLLVLLAIHIYILSENKKGELEGSKSGNYFLHPKLEPVALRLSPTTHYKLDGINHSISEFSALLPKGGHTVHIDDTALGVSEVYTVTLFHQLKCLSIIQNEYVDKKRPSMQPLSPLARHCLNYLKQTFLCRPSTGIEWIVNPYAHAVRSYEMACRDWTAVFGETERNQKAWSAVAGRSEHP